MECFLTEIPDVVLLKNNIFEDGRGWFTEVFSSRSLQELNIGISFECVQINHSYSAKIGTMRGLHWQTPPMAQGKIVRCLRGAIFDVALDLRKTSPTWLKWIGIQLSSDSNVSVLIPKGFAHGFITLSDDTEVFYLTDALYSPNNESSLRFDDPDVGIKWPEKCTTISQKDADAPFLKDVMDFFE